MSKRWEIIDDKGEYQIVNSDCVEFLEGVCGTEVIDLVFADPPYNIGIDYGDHHNDKMSDDEYIKWCTGWIGEIPRILKDDGSFWLLCNHEYAADLDVMIRKEFKLHRQKWITWYESFGVNCQKSFNRCSRPLLWYTKHKKKFTANYLDPEVRRPSDRQAVYNDPRASPLGKCWDDVWGINPPIPRVCGTFKERIPGFPTQLPLKLLRPIIAFASNPGDVVLDPFSGSGTTGMVCIEKDRLYTGIELSEKFFDLSVERLAKAYKEKQLARQAIVPDVPSVVA